MPDFRIKLSSALRTQSPLRLAYGLGFRGPTAKLIGQNFSRSNLLSAKEIADLIQSPLDFQSREKFSELDDRARVRIAEILTSRNQLVENTVSFRPNSNERDLQRRVSPDFFLATDQLYEGCRLDYLASQRGHPPEAVRDYVDLLTKDVPPEVIKQIFPEGYLFKEYFFWIDFPLRNAYVFKFKDEFYFHFYNPENGTKFTLKSKDYGRLLVKALNALAAFHLGPSAADLRRLQVIPSRNCNDHCRLCPFILDNKTLQALTEEQADSIIDFLNANPAIDSLLFVGNGEPFLNYPVILRIIQGSQHLRNIALYTNGFWGHEAERYFSEMSTANPQTEITINLGLDAQHCATNTQRAKYLAVRFVTFAQRNPGNNLRLHLRGLLFDSQVVSNDPILAVLRDLGLGSGEITDLRERFEKGERVKLGLEHGEILVSYNHLKTSSDPGARPENLRNWLPSLVVTDEGTIGIGSYELAVPVVDLGDVMPGGTAFEVARSNIIFHLLDSPILVDVVDLFGLIFPETFDRTYLATDLLRNIFENPSRGLTFTLALYQAVYQMDSARHQFLGRVLADLGIDSFRTISEIQDLTEEWLKTPMPGAVSRKKNWWAGQERQAARAGRSGNRWLSFWIPEEQRRAQELATSFDERAVVEHVENFLESKYGIEKRADRVTSISITGSSIYSFSQTCPVTDVDYITTVSVPGITDIYQVPGTETGIWVVSEDYFKSNSVRGLHVDLAINIENGLVLSGQNPVSSPAPISERVKMAYFYANLIQRILFDRNLRDSFKRIIELKRILMQVKQCLNDASGSSNKSGILAEDDQKNFIQIRDIFNEIFGDFEFDQIAAWQQYDQLATSGDSERQALTIKNIFAEAAALKPKLLKFLARVEPLSGENHLYQESRQHTYAVFNASKVTAPLEQHQSFLRDFPADYSITVTLAENSPHLAVYQDIEARLNSSKNPFTPEQSQSIHRALEKNPHFQKFDYHQIRRIITFDSSNGGHQEEVRTVDFFPDGQKIITAAYDHTAKLMNVSPPQTPQTFGGHDGIVQCARVSPDGSLVVTASRDGSVKLLDAKNLNEIFKYTFPSWVMWADFIHNGQQIICGLWDGTAAVIEWASGKLVHAFEKKCDGPLRPVRVTGFSPDDRLVFIGGDDAALRFYSWPNGRPQWVLSQENGGHQGTILFAGFNHRGDKTVSTGDDGRVVIADIAGKKVIQVLGAQELGGFLGNTRAADFSPTDEFLAIVDSVGACRVVDWVRNNVLLVYAPLGIETGTKKTFKGFTSVRFSRDGSQLALARADGVIQILQFNQIRQITK